MTIYAMSYKLHIALFLHSMQKISKNSDFEQLYYIIIHAFLFNNLTSCSKAALLDKSQRVFPSGRFPDSESMDLAINFLKLIEKSYFNSY